MTANIPYKSQALLSSEQIIILIVFFIAVLICTFVIKKYRSPLQGKNPDNIENQSKQLSRNTIIHTVTINDKKIVIIESDKNITRIEE